ncbi:RNA-directed DNA polymerase, eukaryota, reverse transcriptase zinc-binding domain protein [Tanacetum coccineum]
MFRKHSAIVDEDGFLAIYGEWSNMGIACLMIIVYAPQDISRKCALWNRLCNLILSFHAMVIVLGDFNEVRNENERLDTLFCKKGASVFNNFITNSNLVDLPMGGRKFTRMNKFGTKINDPLLIKDYRPISLIGCQYKVIAKILANRLQQVVHSVISEVQTAYVEGRQIIDGPLIVNEVISWASKKKERLFILKVDFEKAFDSLDWKFLDHIMEQMGFSGK